MTVEFKLPDLGEGIYEAEVLNVKVVPGQTVEMDQPIVEVETDKAVVEIPSPIAGVVESVHVKTGQLVKVGSTMISFTAKPGTNGKSIQTAKTKDKKVTLPDRGTLANAPATNISGPKTGTSLPEQHVAAAPAVRQLAREMGVAIEHCQGSGPNGRILREDVLRQAGSKGAAGGADSKVSASGASAGDGAYALPAFLSHKLALPNFSKFGEIEKAPLKSVRRKIAENMALAHMHIPAVAHFDECDITELDEFRKKQNEQLAGNGTEKITLTAFLLKAAVFALKKYPQFNSSLDEDNEEIIYKKYFNIGISVATERGLIVPVIRQVDCKTVTELAQELSEIVNKTRKGKIELSNLQGGTFTVTNPGTIGGTGSVPMVNFPEAAILAAARADLKPVVHNNEMKIRRILPLALCFDHRIADGAEAAYFVNHVISYLSHPDKFKSEI